MNAARDDRGVAVRLGGAVALFLLLVGQAQVTVLDAIEAISGTRLPEAVIAAAWENLTFTWDPVASSLAGSAQDATDAGLLDPVDLDGIYELSILNELLDERGDSPVSGL